MNKTEDIKMKLHRGSLADISRRHNLTEKLTVLTALTIFQFLYYNEHCHHLVSNAN